jgi:DNA polymerase V
VQSSITPTRLHQAKVSNDSAREHAFDSFPFFSSQICAGFPSPADDHQEGRIDLNKELVRNPLSTFFVRVSGDSMINAGIDDGDLLIVDKASTVADGHVIIAVVNADFCVRRFSMSGQQVTLLSANSQYAPLLITEDTDFEVWGRVLFIIKKA